MSDNRSKSLAMAMSIAKKNKRSKMAKGGEVNESAKSEHRPMPDERDQDAKMVERNSSMKAPKDDNVSSDVTVRQAQKPSVTKLKHPSMVPSNAFSTRLRSEEDDLQSSAKPGPYGEQPPKHDDEEGADRQGPSVPALKMKMMARGGDIPGKPKTEETVVIPDSGHGKIILVGQNRDKYAKGGDIEGKPKSENTVVIPDKGHGKIILVGQNREQYAQGGEIDEDDSMLQPQPEADEEHHASVAAAIMAKRRKMAEGGDIKSHDSIYSDDSDQVDLSRNADEDANEEDQLSFNALRKENYSESEGLEQLDQPEDSNEIDDPREDRESDKHDMVSAIRRKMSMKRR